MSDLTKEQDLMIAVMNLISLEEHLTFSYLKTEEHKFFEVGLIVREIRRKRMAELGISDVGESWCISKHLLASIMRLMEVGTKENKLNLEEIKSLMSVFYLINGEE